MTNDGRRQRSLLPSLRSPERCSSLATGDSRGSGVIDVIVTGKFGGLVWFEKRGK
jgi:hypothetical protein